jgi:hypothetical protein
MKYQFVRALLLLSVPLALGSCAETEKEDLVNTVNKNGSIETAVTVSHLDSLNDVLTTKHVVWCKGNLFKTIEIKDTIPALGMTNVEAENEAGETKNLSIRQPYEIFITVK